MYGSVGLVKFLKVMLYVNAGLAIALANNFFQWLPNIPDISAVSISVIAVSAVVFLAGQSTLFPWLCSLPLIWRIFPNIDGEYEVEISSNWSVIKARSDGREPVVSPEGDVTLFKKMGRAKITARLVRIDVSLTMDDRYLTSETVTCALQRDKGEHKPVLVYVYSSDVPTPKNTDSQRHLGAARIPIPLERRPMVLEGNYWTDRNWHKGLNTAGHIRLRRN